MIKVSIIIPVYNVEKYLERCLESVINQTLKDIEIICIDDCSTDNSLSILEKYKEKDSRIVLIKNERNMGRGDVRNVGLKVVKGEYIGFVDSDDYIDKQYFEILYNTAKKYDSDIVNTNSHFPSPDKVGKTKLNKEGVLNYKGDIILESMRNWFMIEYSISVTIWSKLWKTEFIIKNKMVFLYNILSEDIAFVLTSLAYDPKISYNDNSIYYYIPAGSYEIDYLDTSILRAKTNINYYRENRKEYVKNIFNATILHVYDSSLYSLKNGYDKNILLEKLINFFEELNLSDEELKGANLFLKTFYKNTLKYKNIKVLNKLMNINKIIRMCVPPFILRKLRIKNIIL